MNWLSLRWHHETDSRRSRAGFPDYCIVGPAGVMFLEIKSDKGKATSEQVAWVADLVRAGQVAYVAHPSDWDRVLSDLKRIAGRGTSHGDEAGPDPS